MFKLFISLLICVALASFCYGSIVERANEVHKRGNDHFKAAAQTVRSKLRVQSFSGSVPGSYLLETSFYNGVGCGGLNPEVTVYKANACIGFNDHGVTKYMKNECYMDTKQGQRSYYLDAECTVADNSSAPDIVPTDTCTWDFILSCHSDASALNLLKNVEMVVAFGDAAQLANNDVKNAKMIFNGEPLKRITGIKPEDRVACNNEIAYGQCVDVTNAKSYTRIALGFDSGALNLYSRINGMGEVARVPFPMPVLEDGGLHYTVRYPVTGWYDQYFGSGTSGASMSLALDEDEA